MHKVFAELSNTHTSKANFSFLTPQTLEIKDEKDKMQKCFLRF